MSIRYWATKGLRHGDLSALSGILQGNGDSPDPERLARLNRRGFVKLKGERPVVTVMGRGALLIRRLTRHR